MNNTEKEKASVIKPILWFIWIFGWLFTTGLILPQITELTKELVIKLLVVGLIMWPIFLGIFIAG